MRPLLTATPSPTAPKAGTPTSSTGRKMRLKSRTKRKQNLMVAVMLRTHRQHKRSKQKGGTRDVTYLAARRMRLSSILYTPSRRPSFSTRMTGPSSGSTHGQPLVERSGSVAARKMAPATRGTGVIGMPASRSLTGRSRMDVSFRSGEVSSA